MEMSQSTTIVLTVVMLVNKNCLTRLRWSMANRSFLIGRYLIILNQFIITKLSPIQEWLPLLISHTYKHLQLEWTHRNEGNDSFVCVESLKLCPTNIDVSSQCSHLTVYCSIHCLSTLSVGAPSMTSVALGRLLRPSGIDWCTQHEITFNSSSTTGFMTSTSNKIRVSNGQANSSS